MAAIIANSLGFLNDVIGAGTNKKIVHLDEKEAVAYLCCQVLDIMHDCEYQSDRSIMCARDLCS